MNVDRLPRCPLPGYRLRAATPDDAEAILDMDRSHMKAQVEKHYRWDEEEARRLVLANLERARVATFEVRMVGGYYWWIEEPGIAVLHSIQVDAAHRNQGLGRWLVACFEAEALAAGLKRAGLAVFTDNTARALYERLGYAVTVSDGPNAVEMEKRLTVPEDAPSTHPSGATLCAGLPSVARVLLTGMSGVGKSSVVGELRRLGFTAIDMDEPGWSVRDAAGHQLWCEERLDAALAAGPAGPLFVSGCAENQVKFHPRFDHIVLLSAPAEVLRERLAARADNPYGKRPEELAEVLDHLGWVEPLLRRSATHEIQTTVPLDRVVGTILSLVEPGRDGPPVVSTERGLSGHRPGTREEKTP